MKKHIIRIAKNDDGVKTMAELSTYDSLTEALHGLAALKQEMKSTAPAVVDRTCGFTAKWDTYEVCYIIV